MTLILLGSAIIISLVLYSNLPLPRAIKAKRALIIGSLGAALFGYSVINTVTGVTSLLQSPKTEDYPTVDLPLSSLNTEDLKLEDLNIHLLSVDNQQSLNPKDWTIKEYSAPAISGFHQQVLDEKIIVSLRNLRIDGVTNRLFYEYSWKNGGEHHSGTNVFNFSNLSIPKKIDGSYHSSTSYLKLGKITSIASCNQVYCFLSRTDSPLVPTNLNTTGLFSGIRYIQDITSVYAIQDTGSASQGYRWTYWMGGNTLTLTLSLVLLSFLSPWHKGLSFAGLFFISVFVTIGLDKWSVSYAANVANDSSKPVATRFLAMQQLHNSFFFRQTAKKELQSSSTEGFSEFHKNRTRDKLDQFRE